MLSEENDYLVDKNRSAVEDLREMQARNHELEKQVASLGDGISLEARLLSRKAAALQQKEAALKAASEMTRDGRAVEISALRLEADVRMRKHRPLVLLAHHSFSSDCFECRRCVTRRVPLRRERWRR